MIRHTLESLASTVLLVVSGACLFAFSRSWGIDGSLVRQAAAFGGPLALILGIGMAVHGRTMPTNHISVPARVWGVLGSGGAIVNLWTLGYFNQGVGLGRTARLLMPVALVAAWFLPARFYGENALREPASSGTTPEGEVD
jgi:hypothetical protein